MSAGNRSRFVGVILAAGRGRRMGGTKQLAIVTTPDGAKPLVAAAYDAIRPVCDEMVVVLGHAANSVAAALGERGFERTQSDADAPMFQSIRAGIHASRQIDATATILLMPGDQPHVARSTLEALIDQSKLERSKAVIPQFEGCGGHPAVIPPAVAADLLHVDCPTGLADFWLAHPELCVRITVDDPAVLRDVDEPADLDRPPNA